MSDLRSVHIRIRDALARHGVETADLDARLLIEHFAGAGRSDFVLRPDRTIDPEALAAIDAAVARRLAGEPAHRIVGAREFYSLPMKLSKDTLEPRPDTETLVDAVLPFVKQRAAAMGTCRILDLGTGTGAIALALLSQVPQARAVGIDLSEGAVVMATVNAAANGLAERFEARQSNWFSAVDGAFDLIVSNPPYIRSSVVPTLSREVREHDPLAALDGGADGLDAYRVVAESCGAFLADGGLVGMEIGFDQQEDVAAIFAGRGFAATEFRRDLSGNNRVILFQKA